MSLKLSRILHAGYIFETNSARVVFDPVFETPFSVNCYSYPEVFFDTEKIKKQKFDAIFISHFHDDHCSFESLNLIDRKTPIYMYCVHEEMFDLLKQLGFQCVQPLYLGESVIVGNIQVKPVRALDADVDVIFHIQSEGLNVLNVVDSWIDEAMLRHLSQISWDMILWPFQLMREVEVLSPSRVDNSCVEFPIQWKQQLIELKPKVIVPSSCQFRFESWSWLNQNYFSFSYKMFSEQIGEMLPTTKIQKLNPGQSLILTSYSNEYSEPLDWASTVDSQDVDYIFQPGRVMNTSEIAGHLGIVEPAVKHRVLKFCHSELLEQLKNLVFVDESFFRIPRIWLLSLYDSNGEVIDFYYQLNGQKTELINGVGMPQWRTEIPLIKLFGALENGESLSSLYIRINDMAFDSEIEKQLNNVDLLEDPLLRCLYDGKFAGYQKVQLRKLLNTIQN